MSDRRREAKVQVAYAEHVEYGQQCRRRQPGAGSGAPDFAAVFAEIHRQGTCAQGEAQAARRAGTRTRTARPVECQRTAKRDQTGRAGERWRSRHKSSAAAEPESEPGPGPAARAKLLGRPKHHQTRSRVPVYAATHLHTGDPRGRYKAEGLQKWLPQHARQAGVVDRKHQEDPSADPGARKERPRRAAGADKCEKQGRGRILSYQGSNREVPRLAEAVEGRAC